RRDQRGVVPRQLRQRLGELLEPAVVRIGTVPNGGVGAVEKGEARRGFWFLVSGLGVEITADSDGLARKRRAVDEAVVGRPAPGGLEVAARELSSPGILDDVVAAALGLARERGEQLVSRLSSEERRDQGLEDRDRPVERACVAPGLEVVRRCDVPVRQSRG